MAFLRKSSSILILPLLSLMGCATSPYRVLYQDDGIAELNVAPDRILLECERLNDADEPGLSGFMMHVLDEENTVLTLVQGNTLDNQTCDRRIKKMNAILKRGKDIYLAGRGNLSEPRQLGKTYTFSQKGMFKSNGRVLGFVAIANEYGQCYDAYSGDEEKPCPPEPFPLWTE